MFDVVEVSLTTFKVVGFMGYQLGKKDAEAVSEMACIRRV